LDLEAELTDVKEKDFALAVGIRKVGEPVHAMQLRLTIDEGLNVIDAAARSEWVPYPGHCDSFGDAYRQLVGLNLLRGFRHAVQQRLGGTQGCTHLTELAGVLPTAAIQAFAGEVYRPRDARTSRRQRIIRRRASGRSSSNAAARCASTGRRLPSTTRAGTRETGSRKFIEGQKK